MNEIDPLALGLAAEDLEKIELRRKVAALEGKLLAAGDLKAQLEAQQRAAEQIEREFRVVANGAALGPANWLTKAPKSKAARHATPWFFLSDLHFDEVVSAAEMRGVNAYSREIALMRLQKLAQGFIQVSKEHWSGLTYDGLVMPMGGDIFTGEIHDELKETNEDTMLSSFYFWIGPVLDLILWMADEFGKVHIPVVPGNHGRTTRKPRAKFRARSNFDWLFGQILAQNLAKDSRITFDIPDSADCLIPCYDKNVLMTHGDQASGGAGIGGIWPPIMRLAARKRAVADATGHPFDLLILGHWHQLVYGPQFVVNGSLKGYDEYAAVSNFGYEDPQQAAWLMVPGHGKTWTAPIFCVDRKAEGW